MGCLRLGLEEPVPPDARCIPQWSGRFTAINEDYGVLIIHIDDCRQVPFPEGWTPVGDPLYFDEREVWICVRT